MIRFWDFIAHRCPAAAELGRSAAEGFGVAEPEDDTPKDSFAEQPGRCPHCGASFPPDSDEIDEWSYGYAVGVGDGRAGVQGGTFFRSQCGKCGTPVWAPGTGCRTWAECVPHAVVWHRDRNAHMIHGG